MTAVLRISDGTTTINLLNATDGFSLNAWRPAIAQYKGGGTWQASPLSDGRRMVTRQFGNAVEVFDLKVSSTASQDDIIYNTQELRRLLEKAVDYWTADWQSDPVWVEAQATCETNPRYATIHSWSTPDDDNPYASPFLQPDGAIMDDWSLIIERGHWQSTILGTGDCVEISGLGKGLEAGSWQPSASLDDVHAVINLSLLQDQGAQAAGISPAANIYWSGIRFRTVEIPKDAVIQSAWIEFQAAANDVIDCRLQIVGERSAVPAIYSTYANFRARLLTFASYVWPFVEPWTQGAKYGSIDISNIVQEIVNLAGWSSGDDMAIQVKELGSDTGGWREWASVTTPFSYDPATLHVVWESETEVGRTTTCEKEVFVANKHNLAQLTHIYLDDGGVWSANMVADDTYDLTPAAGAAINDAVYFGIDVTVDNTGPFFSLVFDLNEVDTSGDFIWEYWNGGGWHAFLAIELCDNTSTDQFNNPLQVPGVVSVHWDPQTNWATRDISGDGGPAVDGYWVRVRCTAGSDVVSQQNRSVYTILWPYVTIESGIDGDIPALVEVQFEPKSFETGTDISPGGPLFSSKVLMGLRSLSRGVNFTPFINLNTEQNPDGITVTLGANTSEIVEPTSTTGLDTTFDPPGVVAEAESIQVSFSRSLAQEYYGTYRLLLRLEQNGGDEPDMPIRIEHKINTYTTLSWSEVRYIPVITVPNQIIDFGIWQFPGFSDANADEGATGLQLAINVESTSGAPGDLVFHDLILWPIDEWAGEFADTASDAQGWIGGDRSATGVWRYLSADSIGNPQRIIRSLIKVGDLDVRHNWRAVVNGPAILQANKDQRLWFLSWANNNAGSLTEQQLISDPYVGSTVIVKKAQRYLSMRGAR